MPSPRLILGAICAFLVARVTARCDGLKPSSNPATAPGVEFKVLLKDLDFPRHIVMDPKGNLLIVEEAGRVRRIVLDGGEGLDICVTSSPILVSNKEFKHGIALSHDGTTLFVSTATDVFAYPYNPTDGSVGPEKKIITIPKQGGSHQSRTLLVPRHDPNLLLVSRGSENNIDGEAAKVETARSQIRIFQIDELLRKNSPTPYAEGAVLGWGLRNSVGVGEDISTGNIWSVENSIDEMKRLGNDIHNDNPGEELNFHGLAANNNSAVYGKNYGYPSCVAIGEPQQVKEYPGGAAVGKQMTGEQTAKEYNDEFCQKETIAPRLTFGAHMAPLDIKFQDNGAAAFISFHGSWNRQPPNGYRVSRIAFKDGQPTAPSTSRDAEVRMMWNSDQSKCPGGCFRPVGLLLDKFGRLFMTSDKTGELYVLKGVTV